MAYTAPTPADLKTAFPAFASVDDAVIQFWLDRAARIVDERFPEADFAFARELLACHYMALNKIGTASAGAIPDGVTDFRSGAFQVKIADAVAANAIDGSYQATLYGRQFEPLLMAAKGGPRVVGGGTVPCYGYGYNGYAGPLPPWQC
jgi:hypothetical protein